MKKGNVVLANGSVEVRAKVNHFLSEIKLKNPKSKIKTQADAINFAIEQAEKVPALEARIKELENKEVEYKIDEDKLESEILRLLEEKKKELDKQ